MDASISLHLFFIPLISDKAQGLEEWPEIKAGCVQGPRLTPEGVEILFDPTQRASVCQVKPAQSNTRIDASISFPASLSAIPPYPPSRLGNWLLFAHGVTSLTADMSQTGLHVLALL